MIAKLKVLANNSNLNLQAKQVILTTKFKFSKQYISKFKKFRIDQILLSEPVNVNLAMRCH